MTTCSTNACGVGGWGGPLPGDPDNNSILSATPAFGGIDVSWTYPGTYPEAVAHVVLYRGVVPDFNAAIVIATVGGNFFYDKSTSPQLIQYYYWITIVSVNGTVGAPIGPASAIAKPTIASVIEGLTAQIDAGMLAQSLKTEIDKITLNYSELQSEIADRISANSALSAALADVQSGVDQSLAYIGQEITLRQEGDSALAIQVNSVAAANANNLALIQSESTARVNADSALATQLNTVAALTDSNAAAIQTEQTARANADSALSSSISTVSATASAKNRTYYQTSAPTSNRVTGDIWYDSNDNNRAYRWSGTSWVETTDPRIASTAAALTTEQTARADADSALAAQITTAQTTLNGNIASVQTTLQTEIDTVDGKVTQIGALYTAKLSVDGLIGGFGVYNDGTTVEAGFDVDTFWVGRTQANKRKPFIISNGVTYIDDAAIEKLTFTKLRDAAGAVVIENGKIKADYLNVTTITGGAYTGYAWPAAGQKGFYLGPSGLLLGNYNGGGSYLQYDVATGILQIGGNALASSITVTSGQVIGALLKILPVPVFNSGMAYEINSGVGNPNGSGPYYFVGDSQLNPYYLVWSGTMPAPETAAHRIAAIISSSAENLASGTSKDFGLHVVVNYSRSGSQITGETVATGTTSGVYNFNVACAGSSVNTYSGAVTVAILARGFNALNRVNFTSGLFWGVR